MHRLAVVLSAAVLTFVCFPARADIGGIGSPVVPSNAPAAEQNKNAAPETAPAAENPAPAAEEKPLLVIRFNQKHVYFDRALSQAVRSAEKAKPGVVYDIVSYVPYKSNARSEDERMIENAQANLGSVVGHMLQMGVPASRINTRMEAAPSAGSEEIHIFVK